MKRRDKLPTSTGERKHINTEKVNKEKQKWRTIHKEVITKKYIKQEH
jgi:hypothetical protein